MMFMRMKGPYKLDTAVIDAKVTRKSPGNYILGRKNLEGRFRAGYVGRSNSDIAAFLKSRVGITKQLLFKFSYARSSEAAFKKECKLYHGLHSLGNHSHPTRPKGITWRCPRCGIFDMVSARKEIERTTKVEAKM